MWKRVLAYAVLLAAGTFALQWLDYQRLARTQSLEIYLFLVAAGFLVLGVVVGVRVFGHPAPKPFDGNPQAAAALGLSSCVEIEIVGFHTRFVPSSTLS